MAGGQDSLDWFKDRAKRPEALIDLGGIAGLKGIRETAAGTRSRRADHAHGDRRERRWCKAKYSLLASAASACRESADPQCRHARRQPLPGRALLVLPLRRRLLSRRRQHLLRGHAAGTEPRALPVRRARCIAVSPSDAAPAVVALEGVIVIRQRRGERVSAGRGILHRAVHGHHSHEHPQAGRNPHRDSVPEGMGRREVLFREGRPIATRGISRW